MDYKVRFYISTLYISNFINSVLPTSQHPYIQETRKFDTCFHTNILRIKYSWIHAMKHNISTYEETRNMIQDYFIK